MNLVSMYNLNIIVLKKNIYFAVVELYFYIRNLNLDYLFFYCFYKIQNNIHRLLLDLLLNILLLFVKRLNLVFKLIYLDFREFFR